MKKVIFGMLLVGGLLGFFVPLIMILVFNMDYDAMINNENVALGIFLVSFLAIIGGCVGLCCLSDKFKATLKVVGRCLAEMI